MRTSPTRRRRRAVVPLLALLLGLTGQLVLVAAPTAAVTPATTTDDEPAPLPTVQYTVVDVGRTLPGRSEATGINESGVVVGNYTVNGQKRGFVYEDGTATPLPLEEGLTYASVTSIGDNGTIGGWAAGWDGKFAVLWKRAKNGGYPSLTRLDTVNYVDDGFLDEGGGVLAVNARGDALAQYSGSGKPAIYRATGGRTELLYPDGERDGAYLHDLNDNGQASGEVHHWGISMPGAIWSASGQYGELAGPGGGTVGAALVLNNHQELIADVNGGEFSGVGFLDQDGEWAPINGYVAHDGLTKPFRAHDLNDAGTAVGDVTISTTADSTRKRAMLWREGDDAVTDLTPLVPEEASWTLGIANAINERGQIVGAGLHNGGTSAYLLDRTRPVVFVPGAAASMLVDHDDPANPEEIWLGCGTDRRRLSLDEDEPRRARNVVVTDAARSLECFGLDGSITKKLMAYGTFLDTLTHRYGYREYETGGLPRRRTAEGCDVDGQKDRMPNLFVFAYDWRKTNALAAEQLKDFMDCVRQFYPTEDVDIVSHSMGGLVARRYVIDNPEHHVRKHISIGAPWLGAPKLVNVLNTGDFIPLVASGAVVKEIMGGFAAPHQLMSAQHYHRMVGPVFHEDGWDYDEDGTSKEDYTWSNLANAIDDRWSSTTPATTAEQWHGYSTEVGGQVDWRGDRSGVDYVHIHGIQEADVTIGSVTAKRDVSCVGGIVVPRICTYGRMFETGVTQGDGTVPTPSATRRSGGEDLNADGAEVYPVHANGDDDSVEHTALMWNPEVIEKTIAELREKDDDTASTSGLASERSAAADGQPAAPYRYVRLRGLSRAVVTDAAGTSNATVPGTDVRGTVPGVHTFTEGDDAELVALPLGDRPWTVDMTGTGRPARIEIREGAQDAPREKVRYDDLFIPDGVAARLRISASGVEVLRLDLDGDGEHEKVVAPSSVQTGAAASDVTAPVVELTAQGDGAERRYSVAVTDGESGVRDVLWSTDGRTFAAYDGPIDAGTATTLHVVATDHAGNRGIVGPVDLAGVRRTALTTATVTPAPNAAGWSTGDVQVALEAVPAGADAPAVTALRWETGDEETRVEGSTTTIPVTAVGTTVLRFRAETADGELEPWRSVTVRIDAAAPTATLRSPRAGSVVPTVVQLAGRAADDASGVASVAVSLQRTADGRHWDGSAWVDARTWVDAGGRSTWRLVDVPRAGDLPNGAYAVRVRVTDNAGRTTVTAADTFRVAPDAAVRLTALAAPDGKGPGTSAPALNDRGAAAGVAADGIESSPVRWDGARPVALDLPDWATSSSVHGIDDDGRVVGTVTSTDRSSAAVWDADGAVTLLDGREQDDRGGAYGVSRAGVVGESAGRPVQWDADGAMTVLPGRDGYADGRAEDIDSAGLAVGHLLDEQGTPHATVWEDGHARRLGDLGGGSSYATALNEVGQAVGVARDGTNRNRPFIVDLHDGSDPRPIYVPGSTGKANDVNDAGQVVGEYTVPTTGRVHGFIESDGVFVDLNQWLPAGSGWEVVRAYAINDVGQVVAFATKDGVGRAVILSAEHAPTAGDVDGATTAGVPVTVTLAGEDVDPMAVVRNEVVAGPGHGTLSEVDGATVVYTPEPGFSGADSFTYRATDGEFRSGTATVTITVEEGEVANLAPTARLVAPEKVAEGTTVTLDAAGSTDADGTIAGYAWDLDGDGAFDDGDGATATSAILDDGVHDVRVRVTDDDGATAIAAARVVGEGVAPVVELASEATATTGSAWSLAGTFRDPGADTVTGQVDYGSGAAPLTLTEGRFTIGSTYVAAGRYPVRVRLCDDDGACAVTDLTVVVTDGPLADVRATWGGYVAVPGSTDTIALGGTISVRDGKAVGLAAIARSGKRSLSVGLVVVTGGGRYSEGGQTRIRVTGTGRVAVAGGFRAVRFVIELVDAGKADAAWLEVTDATTGAVVPELSLPRVAGRPSPVPLRAGGVQQL